MQHAPCLPPLRGGIKGGVHRTNDLRVPVQVRENSIDDSAKIVPHLIVPEPQDTKPKTRKCRVPQLVAIRSAGVTMLTTVDLNDEALF